MKQPVEISAELTRQEAELLLAELRSRYGQVLNEVWYADPFRLIPEGLRHGSILMAMPVMAQLEDGSVLILENLDAEKHVSYWLSDCGDMVDRKSVV